MIAFFADVVTVIVALYMYDRFKDWRKSRRYGGY